MSWTKDDPLVYQFDQFDQFQELYGFQHLPTKCGTGSKDCSKVRLKCWMVLGYTPFTRPGYT